MSQDPEKIKCLLLCGNTRYDYNDNEVTDKFGITDCLELTREEFAEVKQAAYIYNGYSKGQHYSVVRIANGDRDMLIASLVKWNRKRKKEQEEADAMRYANAEKLKAKRSENELKRMAKAFRD